MRKVPLLTGLAALAAAGVALVLLLDRPGSERGSGERAPTVARPGDAPARPRASELAGPAAREAGAEDDAADRVRARVTPKVAPGDETVVPVVAHDEDELYGIVLGIYGVPVANAEVEVEAVGDAADGLIQVLGGSTDQTVRTGPDGRFRVARSSRWEEVRITITARGFLQFERNQDLLDRAGDQDLGVFELDAGVVLAGRVLDADGDPVAGAAVVRIDPGENDSFRFGGFGSKKEIETDGEGRFELDHEEPGEYVLVVEHDDHPKGRFPGVAPPPGSEDTSLVLRLARGATIAGRIAELPRDREHVRVSAAAVASDSDTSGFAAMMEESGFSPDGLEGEVAADGSFRIQGLEAGRSYRVRAYVRGGFFGRVPVSDEATARAGDQEVDLLWDPGGRVTARVVDAATSAEVRDVEARYRWDEEDDDDFRNQTRKRSFADGKVEIGELRPTAGQRMLSLLFSAPGYLDLRHDGVAVDADGEVDLGTIRMRRAPLVRIQVVDSDGDGVSRARVRLEPEESDEETGAGGRMRGPSSWFTLEKRSASGKTDSDGVVELPAPATATARLEVAHTRYAGYVRAGMPMPTQDSREETVRLIEGGTIEIYVVDAHGNPVPDMRVEHRYPEGALEDEQATHETNSRGEVRLRHELPGTHELRTSERSGVTEGGDREWQEVVVVDGRTSEVVLEVAARATLAGQVTEAGVPLDRATVALLNPATGEDDDLVVEYSAQLGRYGPRGFDSNDRTNRAGRYELEEVPAGEYRLSVTHAERAAAHVVPITVRGGENRLDVDLPVTSVEGRVTNASGAPIEGARLKVLPVKGKASAEDDLERQAFEEFFGGGDSGARSGPDGAFRLRGVPAGKPFRVEASHDDHVAARSDELEVRVGQVRRNVDVALSAGGSLRVRVAGDSGPFTFLRARWDGEKEGAPKPKIAMVRRSEAAFTGLRPGRWRITQDDDDEGQVVQVAAGMETAVDFAP
jgi:uncharacterized GH25 family protein